MISLRPCRIVLAGCSLALFGLIAESNPAVAGEAATDLTEGTNPAKNLARMNCGATIELVGAADKSETAKTLLLDDDTLSYPLAEGETTLVISFPRVSVLDRFAFVNENGGAQGEVKLAVSNYRLPTQSQRWNQVSSTAFGGKRLIDLSLLGIEARYVRLTFQVAKGGRIAALGLYGGQSLQKFAARQQGVTRITNKMATRRLEDMLNFNFANLYARARIVFVSSGATGLAKRMIDDDVITSFEFAQSDPQPTVVVELAERERLHRVSAVYKMEQGRLDVFLLQELGQNPGDLQGRTPIASVTDQTGAGKAAVDFDTKGARYVALRWTPADPKTTRTFEVAEVSAFGEMPLSMLSTSELPDVYADNSIGLMSPPLVVQPPVLPLISP
ncbi:MAG TPA: hypothetical protein VM940_02880 [Chthoniobacterales bacterium]|nr:hypothetical protein [Chthoniobacterales bacterium]